MLAGCRLLRGRYRLLAVVGSILWSAAAGDGRLEKAQYALVMLAGLWLFYLCASWRREACRPAKSGPVICRPGRGLLIARSSYVQTVALLIFALEFPFEGLSAASTGAKATARHPAEAQVRHQLHLSMLLHRRQQ